MGVTLDWNQVDTVLLDMDGTVLDLAFDTLFWSQIVPQRFAELNGIDLAEAIDRLTPIFRAKQGTLDWYCTDFWSERLAMDIKLLKREAGDHIDYLPGVPDFLMRLAATGRRVVLVTNAHGDSLQIKLERTRLDRFFHAMFTSHEFGAPKEHLDFWSRLSEREPFDPGRTLFVDDSIEVLRAARSFGIRHTLAISQPVSNGEVRQVEDFSSVRSLAELSL